MYLPQFNTRELFLSSGLIGVGLGAPLLAYRIGGSHPTTAFWIALAVAPAFVGAGIFTPFRRPAMGAIIVPVACLVTFLDKLDIFAVWPGK
jgi:hypothetical protein